MGKPLLTDEIIERANRGELFYDDMMTDDEETKVIRTDHYDSIIPPEEYADRGFLERWTNRKQKDQFVYKSRRIENVKRSRFQRKLNLAILIIFLLLVALFYAVFKL